MPREQFWGHWRGFERIGSAMKRNRGRGKGLVLGSRKVEECAARSLKYRIGSWRVMAAGWGLSEEFLSDEGGG